MEMNKTCINCGQLIKRAQAKKYCTGQCKRLWERSIQLSTKQPTRN